MWLADRSISSLLNGLRSYLFGLPASLILRYSTAFRSFVTISLMTVYSKSCPNNTFSFISVEQIFPLSSTTGQNNHLQSFIGRDVPIAEIAKAIGKDAQYVRVEL